MHVDGRPAASAKFFRITTTMFLPSRRSMESIGQCVCVSGFTRAASFGRKGDQCQLHIEMSLSVIMRVVVSLAEPIRLRLFGGGQNSFQTYVKQTSMC